MIDLIPQLSPMKEREIANIASNSLNKIFGHPQNSLQQGAYAKVFENGGLSKIGIGYGIEELSANESGHYDPIKKEIILSIETYLKLLEDDLEARFVLAHEIGHAVMHGSFLVTTWGVNKQIKLCQRSSLPNIVNPEWQADRFAEAFLMPLSIFRQLIREGKSDNAIAKSFRVDTDLVKRLRTKI